MAAPAKPAWHVVLPLRVVDRPRGVWWARVGPLSREGFGGRLCTDQEHTVYLGVRPPGDGPGQQGPEWKRRFWLCAECWPPPEPEAEGA